MPKRTRPDWKASLRLLADEGVPYRTTRGTSEFRYITRKQLAADLGISERTLRRWINEGKQPNPEHQAMLNRKASSRRRAMKAHGYPTDLPRIPYGHRRMLNEWTFEKGRAVLTGRKYASEWINFHVGGWSVPEMMALVNSLRGFGNQIQFLFRIARGDDRGAHGGTNMYDLDSYTPEDIEEIIWGILERYDTSDDQDEGELNEIVWIGARTAPEIRSFK